VVEIVPSGPEKKITEMQVYINDLGTEEHEKREAFCPEQSGSMWAGAVEQSVGPAVKGRPWHAPRTASFDPRLSQFGISRRMRQYLDRPRRRTLDYRRELVCWPRAYRI
jgi:hypothetical protein